jgi:uncharacterized membrane protein
MLGTKVASVPNPDYHDFAYLAFTFGTAIIAMTINVVASLAK